VAAAVGCSVSSVSLVVSGKAEGRVRQETQDAIHAAIARLGYRLNTTASALASGTSLGVGFLSPDPTNPFFSMVLDGLGDTLTDRYALNVLVPTGGADYDRSTVRRALAGDFAGLVLASPSERLLDGFVPTCPTVLLDAGGPVAGLAGVDVDLRSALAELAAHLTGLGHRRVAYLGFRREKASVQGRRYQLAEALQQRGAVLDATTVELTGLTESAAQAAFASTWPAWRATGVSAVVCGDELFAYGVLRACREQGVRSRRPVRRRVRQPAVLVADRPTADVGGPVRAAAGTDRRTGPARPHRHRQAAGGPQRAGCARGPRLDPQAP
jgi:LacI family transcriptional regulator